MKEMIDFPPVWVAVDARYFYAEWGANYGLCRQWMGQGFNEFKLILLAESLISLDWLYKLGMPICGHLIAPSFSEYSGRYPQWEQRFLQEISTMDLVFAPEIVERFGVIKGDCQCDSLEQLTEILLWFSETGTLYSWELFRRLRSV